MTLKGHSADNIIKGAEAKGNVRILIIDSINNKWESLTHNIAQVFKVIDSVRDGKNLIFFCGI